jgi:hypothetical protein
MTAPVTDPLARLVADEAEVNRELLANVLEGKVRLDLGRGTFTFLQGVRNGLGGRGLVVTALLAQQALHLLQERHASGLAPREIEAATGIPGGTLRPILKRLADKGIVRKEDTGVYTVPGYALEDVAREFDEEE